MEILRSIYREENRGPVHNIDEFPISRRDTSGNRTGTWRTLKPVFEEAIGPCSSACPTNTDIPKYMGLMRKGDLQGALKIIRQENPLPAVCGRVCPGFCEASCNRGGFDQATNIRSVERFVGDYGLDVPPEKEDERGRGKSVAVVGSGPAGLSIAYFLSRHGVSADIFEREAEPGGLLRYGIPEYRLPRQILDSEIENIFSLGVNFMAGRVVRPDDIPSLSKDYDYIFFSPGLWGRNIPDWGYGGKGVYDGLDLLKEVHAGNILDLGRRVTVVGGGNTALDVTRVLMRMGKEVVITYRRTLEEAPAFEDKIREGLEEGIRVLEKRLITGIEAQADGSFKIAMRGAARKQGKIVPSGERAYTTVDSVVAAIGQTPEMRVQRSDKVLLGGDFETGEGTVVQAISSGKRAASAILKRSGLLDRNETAEFFRAGGEVPSRRVVSYERVNSAFFRRSDRFEPKRREAGKRIGDFNEICEGASLEDAIGEAGRCFCCGTCTLCGTCWYFCPDGCVIAGEAGPGKLFFDRDYCKGCAICSVLCPGGCIGMEEE